MDVKYTSFISSKPFKFLVGPTKKEFFIHASLISQISHTLKTLVSGDMIEAKEGCATLDDIREDTFARFAEFAYTGDYSTPVSTCIDPKSHASTLIDPKSPFSSPPISKTEVQKVNKAATQDLNSVFGYQCDDWADRACYGGFGAQADAQVGAQAGGLRATMWHSFKALAASKHGWIARDNKDRDEDYSEVFLSHAELYVVGDRYDISALRALVVQKLRYDLSNFTLHESRVGNVMELVRYTYENTTDLDSLRDLVSDYVVCHIDTIGKHASFLKLLEDTGSAARDIMSKSLKLMM